MPVQTSESSQRRVGRDVGHTRHRIAAVDGAAHTVIGSPAACRPDSRAPRRRSRPRCRRPLSSQRLSLGTFAIPVTGSQLSIRAAHPDHPDRAASQPGSRAPHRRSRCRCRHRCRRRERRSGTLAMPVMGSQLSTVHADPVIGIQRRPGLAVEHRVAGLRTGADVRCPRRGCRSGRWRYRSPDRSCRSVQLTPSSSFSGVPA